MSDSRNSCSEPLTLYQRNRLEGERLAAEDLKRIQAQSRRDRIERLYGHACLPERFRARHLSDLEIYDDRIARAVDICQRYASHFDQAWAHGTCMALVGRPGTGKTHVATAILESVIGRDMVGLYTTQADMLRAFRATYSNNGQTEDQVLDYYAGPDLLVVDEIGFALGNLQKIQATLFDVFDRRYRHRRPTILVGNLTPAELWDYLGERISRRVMEDDGVVIAFDWEPYKGAHR